MSRRGLGMTDHQARYNVGALEQRVYGLEQAIGGISSQISGLASKIDARSATNWPLFYGFGGLFLSVVIAVGALAYWPIRETQADLKAIAAEQSKILSSLGDKFVTIRELDARASRTQRDIDRLGKDMDNQEAVTVPRREHEEKWRSSDNQFADKQRQIDDIKKSFGDTFSLRDALQQMQRRIDALETRAPRS